MRSFKRAPVGNRLLAALPPADFAALQADLETVDLGFGQILHEPGTAVTHVYFPHDSLVSLLARLDDHQSIEVGLIGREGMLGITLALGLAASPVRGLVQGAGTAARMKSAAFLRALAHSPGLQHEIYRYSAGLMAQVMQTAACNRFHVVEARLARWLLMTRDRLESNRFRLTHEFLATMLGVRRVGVTKAAHELQQRKLIDYSRGNIEIQDDAGLEAASCSCYETVKAIQTRIAASRTRQPA
jgi:CRP-like cAMP-binding protein